MSIEEKIKKSRLHDSNIHRFNNRIRPNTAGIFQIISLKVFLRCTFTFQTEFDDDDDKDNQSEIDDDFDIEDEKNNDMKTGT